MSLLFERALREFSPERARHVERAADGTASDAPDDPIELDHLAYLASNRHTALAHPERDEWTCVPLHERDNAELSGEYVAFQQHPVRGDVFVYRDSETGEYEPLDLAAASETALARRLRFWLHDFDPEEPPSYARGGPSTHVTPTTPTPEEERDDYFDRLAQFVADERDAERKRNREMARHHSPVELSERGETAIPELTGFAMLADGTLQCHVAAESGVDVQRRFGVFEDDEVLVHAPAGVDGAPDDFPVPTTVKRITERTLDLVPRNTVENPDSLVDFLNGTDGVGLSLLLNPVTYDREESAVETIRERPDRRDVVVGARDATFTSDAAIATAQRDAELDEAQTFAATAALYADDVCAIHGPPGTGKTRVLVEIVRRTVADGGRVLVCADSNQAVDNVLVGESSEDDLDPSSLHYYAAVEEEFTLDRHHEYHSDRSLVREAYDDDPHRPDVVVTTNNSAADYPDDAFDLAVVDEATQATTPSTLIPYTKAETVVLAGDHKQLPPYHATEDPGDHERYRSLFEHFYADDGIYGPSIGVLLTTQYRMHEDIAAFPNDAFYDGVLRTGVDVDPVEDLPPLVGVDVTGHEREDETGSYANAAEATSVGELVERLLDAGLAGSSVGVITPYQAQVHAVRSELGGLSVPGSNDVTVDTVDSFQGGERAAVVVTFVRSNDRGDVGFLGRAEDGPRRLNVALTRAERFCGLVGDWDTLRDGGDGRNDCAHLYRDLFDRLQRDDRV